MNTLSLRWLNFDFSDDELSVLKLSDGKYNITTVNNNGELIDTGHGAFHLVKLGNLIKIKLNKISGETIVYKSFKINKINKLNKVLKKTATISDIVKKFLITKCADIQKVMNISNFSTDFEVDNMENDLFEEKEKEKNEEEKTEPGKKNGGDKGDKGGKGGNKTKTKNIKEPTEPSEQTIEENNFRMLERFMGRNFPVKGNVQSGKTKFMISSAIWFMLNGKSSLIILRNYTDDSDQLKVRIKQFSDELYVSLEHSGFPRNLFPVEFVDESLITPDSLNGTTPKIMISIYNNTNLAKINKKIGENEKGKFVLFIDEADMLHKDVELTEMTRNGDLTVASELQNLVNTCFCSFSVSGTILDAILKKTIKVEDLIVLQPPTGYKSHNSFDFGEFPLTKKCKFTTLENDDIVQNDENIIPFLEYFSKLPARHYSSGKHPRYCLMRVSKVKKPMNKFFDTICKDYRSICALLYTGDDLKLHHDSLENITSIRLSNGKNSKNENGIHVFKKGSSPGHILEWLKNNGGAEVFTNIITIAGDLASRGISFGSADFNKCKNPWHLTNMYATFAETTDIPEMIQITGRLCTVLKGYNSLDLHLHVTKDVRENLIKGFNLTEEFVSRAANVQEKEASVNEYVSNLNIFKHKVPDSSRPLTKFSKFTPKKVRSLKDDVENGGWMTDEKGRYILRIVKKGEEETLSNLTKEGPVVGTIIEDADHPETDDYDPIEIKKKSQVEKSQVEKSQIEGFIIYEPLNGKSLEVYKQIVSYLSDKKNKWIPLVEIRKIFNTEKRVQIHLHEKTKEIGSRGLLWRQLNGLNSAIDYCLIG